MLNVVDGSDVAEHANFRGSPADAGQVRLEVPVSGQHLRRVVGQLAVFSFVPFLDVWDAGPRPAPSADCC